MNNKLLVCVCVCVCVNVSHSVMSGSLGPHGQTTEHEMVGWHHQLEGQEFEQTPGAGDGQGSLACCSPWGCKESDTTE